MCNIWTPCFSSWKDMLLSVHYFLQDSWYGSIWIPSPPGVSNKNKPIIYVRSIYHHPRWSLTGFSVGFFRKTYRITSKGRLSDAVEIVAGRRLGTAIMRFLAGFTTTWKTGESLRSLNSPINSTHRIHGNGIYTYTWMVDFFFMVKCR